MSTPAVEIASATHTRQYTHPEPTREEIDALRGDSLIEFGAPWCGVCISAQPRIERVLARHPHVRHLKIEDGSKRPLGRSFGIKLWPSLVLVRNGMEVERVVRPRDDSEIARLLAIPANDARRLEETGDDRR